MLFPFTEKFCILFEQSESASIYTQKKQSEDAANMTMSNAEGRIELINCPKWLTSIGWVYKSNMGGGPSGKRKLRVRIKLQTVGNGASCDVNQVDVLSRWTGGVCVDIRRGVAVILWICPDHTSGSFENLAIFVRTTSGIAKKFRPYLSGLPSGLLTYIQGS
jgi:hypothetical protein